MKAKYNAKRSEDNLTTGRKYTVTDVRCTKVLEVQEIHIKNDGNEEQWYKVGDFTLYAEMAAAAAFPISASAAMPAMAEAITKGDIKIGIDLAAGKDMTAGLTAKQGAEIGKAIAEGMAAGIKGIPTENSTDCDTLESQIKKSMQNNLMFGA